MRNKVFNGIRNLRNEKRKMGRYFVLPKELLDKAKELGIKNDVNETVNKFPLEQEGVEFVNVGFEGTSSFSKEFYFDKEVLVYTVFGVVRSIRNLITYLNFDVSERIYHRSKPFFSKRNLKPRRSNMNIKSVILLTVLSSIYTSNYKKKVLLESGDLPITALSMSIRTDKITNQKFLDYRLMGGNGAMYVAALRVARIMLKADMLTKEMINEVVNANKRKGIELYEGFGIEAIETKKNKTEVENALSVEPQEETTDKQEPIQVQEENIEVPQI